MENIGIKSVSWLSLPNTHEFARVPMSDMNKRKRVFYEFVYWTMNEFLIPLLKTSFYITETGPHKNSIL